MFLIPADIPLITEGEINSILEAHPPAPSLTIIPSNDMLGSNCLLISPPLKMTMKFGPDSYYQHQKIALKLGLKVNSMKLPGFGLDIDEPKDLLELLKSKGNTRSQKYLRQLNLVKN